MVRGVSPNPFPIIRGSSTFPTIVLINKIQNVTHSVVVISCSMSVIIIGGNAAIIDPITGIKFKKKANIAHKYA